MWVAKSDGEQVCELPSSGAMMTLLLLLASLAAGRLIAWAISEWHARRESRRRGFPVE